MRKNVVNRTKSTAQEVREVLLRRPFLMNALRLGIVNYSALARYLRREVRASTDAIKASILRERKRGIAEMAEEKEILDLLKRTKISMRDKVAILIADKELEVPYLIKASLSDSYVYLVDQTKAEIDPIRDANIIRDMVALTLTSPVDIEHTPGFVAFITQILASKGLNIRELISCYTDTVVVLRAEDAIKAFALLEKFV
ncbi:MAG: hypothetical protein ACE5OY_01430 [Candidatus Bathyarchaeia archaeon]